MAVLAAAFDVWEAMGPKGRAAAALGIYTDTSTLLHGATPLDFRMFEKLTRDDESGELVDELRDYRVPPEWFEYRTAAFLHVESTGAVRVAPVGYVREDFRDVIAEIANDLLRVEGTSIAIAVAVTERGTEVSVRADSRLLGQDRERIVRVIDYLLGYAFPGVSPHARPRTAWRAARSCPTARQPDVEARGERNRPGPTRTRSSSTAAPAPGPSRPSTT
jgi:hypothetical protein